jgi:undecaprenyl-diphosphatase
VHDLVAVHGYSFPSGHAAGSFAFYGFSAYVAVRLLPRRWHLPLAGLALLLVVFVGASRVMLQVHFFSDVVGGWLGAAAWTALCITVLESLKLSRAQRSGAQRAGPQSA